MEYLVSDLKSLLVRGTDFDWLCEHLFAVCDTSDDRDLIFNSLQYYLSQLKSELTIVLESEYIDKMYRDSYYHLYSTKLKSYHRNCVRISFFDTKDISVLDSKETMQAAYRGFIVVRPLIIACIGRTVIDPRSLKDGGVHLKLCKTKVHSTCCGIKLEVEGFPHSSQDAEMMSCAETSIWTICEYFGNKYKEYTPALPSDIIDALEPFSFERQLPSNGLSFDQISVALKQFGFGPKIYDKGNPIFKELFACYVESGLPLAVCIQNDQIGHAIVCVGRTDKASLPTIMPVRDYPSWNEQIEEFVFNDDNLPCYSVSPLSDPVSNYTDPDFAGANVEYFIVPLHEKVYVDAEVAIKASRYLAEKELHAPKDSVLRTFLTSSRTYREYIATSGNFKSSTGALLSLDLPKFVWVTEIASRTDFDQEQANGIILIDATGSTHYQILSLLFASYGGDIILYDKSTRSYPKYTKAMPMVFKSFPGNLH